LWDFWWWRFVSVVNFKVVTVGVCGRRKKSQRGREKQQLEVGSIDHARQPRYRMTSESSVSLGTRLLKTVVTCLIETRRALALGGGTTIRK
jgi:hypothetical protein